HTWGSLVGSGQPRRSSSRLEATAGEYRFEDTKYPSCGRPYPQTPAPAWRPAGALRQPQTQAALLRRRSSTRAGHQRGIGMVGCSVWCRRGGGLVRDQVPYDVVEPETEAPGRLFPGEPQLGGGLGKKGRQLTGCLRDQSMRLSGRRVSSKNHLKEFDPLYEAANALCRTRLGLRDQSIGDCAPDLRDGRGCKPPVAEVR